jgi:RNA polymerase sigma factor (sigma-70 family)
MDLDALLAAARSRDPSAWEALGRGLSDELTRFFANCFDRCSTEELVQTTVLVVMCKLDGFEPIGPHGFRNWVMTIAARQARTHSLAPRREQARRSKLNESGVEPSPAPTLELLACERRIWIDECLTQLPDRHLRTLESELAGDDYQHVAAREGISVGGARVRRHRAHVSLRKLVEA